MSRLNSVILCTRLNSRRVPGKALKKINGKPMLFHLLDRLIAGGLKVIVAAPTDEMQKWLSVRKQYEGEVDFFFGSDNDPLFRMYSAARFYDIQHCIRVTHDKIFVNPDDIYQALNIYMTKALDYAYSSSLTEGTGFEIISTKTLEDATKNYKNVEHISYAIKATTKNSLDIDFTDTWEPYRLLCDYEEDFTLMETIMACLGNNCTQDEAFQFLHDNYWASQLNALPEVTVYTCAFNAEKWIETSMGSVQSQARFKDFEYILVDDHSNDKTPLLMSKFKSSYDNVKYIRNGKNIGLSSSSNVALSHARGKYIVRLDADDFFSSPSSIVELLGEIKSRDLDAVYPNNYHGGYDMVQKGSENHHVGGAIFKTRAVNHIKFTDKLRNYEGLDFFGRARTQLNIGYINKPLFFYRQHDDSMSKTNLEERSEIKKKINERYGLDVPQVPCN